LYWCSHQKHHIFNLQIGFLRFCAEAQLFCNAENVCLSCKEDRLMKLHSVQRWNGTVCEKRVNLNEKSIKFKTGADGSRPAKNHSCNAAGLIPDLRSNVLANLANSRRVAALLKSLLGSLGSEFFKNASCWHNRLKQSFEQFPVGPKPIFDCACAP
jgi:hypothetical protein